MAITKTKQINPMKFVLGELTGSNLMVVSLKQDAIPAGTPVGECMDYLERTLPAGTSYLIFTMFETNLTQCPTSVFDVGDTEAFQVNVSSDSVAAPVSGSRVTAAATLY